MSGGAALVILYFSLLKTVDSLDCYSTNIDVAKPIKLNKITHSLKDCGEFIKYINKSQNKEGELSIRSEMRCFRIDIITDYEENAAITGCFPKNGCRILKDRFQETFKSISRNVECMECDTDGCNFVVKSKRNDVNGSPSSQKEINLLAVFIFLIIGILTV